MITSTISQQIQAALKSGDSLRASTLRLLSSSLHNEKIAKMRDLTEEEELAIVRRELKRREEAVEALRQAQGKLTSSSEADLKVRVGQETKEAEILKEFLPEQMSESELSDIVNKVIEETKNGDFGLVMREVMKQVAGRAEGRAVSELVKERIS